MGGVSNICSDKTGTLTLNQMKVVRAHFGKSDKMIKDELPFGVEAKSKLA